MKENMSFVILEALDRIGGRVFSEEADIEGVPYLERGANWVSGSDSNFILWPYIAALNISGHETDWTNTTIVAFGDDERTVITTAEKDFWFDRIQFHLQQCEALVDELWAFAASTKYQVTDAQLDLSVFDCLTETGYYNRSFGTSVGVSPLNMSLAQWNRLAEVMIWQYVTLDFTEPPPVVSSMWSFPANPDMEPRDYFVQEGYVNVLAAIAEPFFDNILLNQTVNLIDWNSSSSNVTVTTTSGAEYHAGAVIITVPLGVLQGAIAEDPAQPLRFVPPLPAEKRSALENMRMGVYAKITAVFQENFWGSEEFFVVARNQTGNLPWAMNLDRIFPGANAIQFHIVGDDARRYEQLPLNDTVEEIIEMLEIYVNSEVPAPIDVHVTQWSTDPQFNGSYFVWPIGLVEDQWLEALRPLDQKLFFAGEHTSTDYFAFVHGALQSGNTTVDHILRSSSSYDYGYYYYYYYDDGDDDGDDDLFPSSSFSYSYGDVPSSSSSSYSYDDLLKCSTANPCIAGR